MGYMKPFIISEQEREEILKKHVEATGRQYLPESKHETDEIYSFKDTKHYPSSGYSDIEPKDFDEFDFDLGFDAEVQKLLIQMSKFKKFNYERLFSDATDILDIDTLIVYGNVDITKIERNINKRIIILNPKELKFNDFAGWKLNSIYNDFIILQRVN